MNIKHSIELSGFPSHIYELIVDGQSVGVIEQYIPNLPQTRRRWKCNRFITHLEVKKEFRGCGYGRELVEHFEKRAREQGLSWIEVNSSVEARGFYEHLGFVRNPRGIFGKILYWCCDIRSDYYKSI